MTNNDQTNKEYMVSDERMAELRQLLLEHLTTIDAEMKSLGEERLQNARKYAMYVLFNTNGFEQFAMEMVEYLGEDLCGLSKSFYVELYDVAQKRHHHMDDIWKVVGYTEDALLTRYQELKEERNRREEEIKGLFKENVDELQLQIEKHRESEEFKNLLEFVGKFHYLAPYNAMLVEMQLPSAKFVFPGKKWREYGRRITPNARKLITLMPFGPVQCMFDYSDTEPVEGAEVKGEAELIEMYENRVKHTKGEIDPDKFEQLVENLPSYGIYLDESLQAANSCYGYIIHYAHDIMILVNRNNMQKIKSRFILSLNSRLSKTDKFLTICHELGHLFCRHLFYRRDLERKTSIIEREFEAETVAWLMAKRHGVSNPSEKYLSWYGKDGKIPLCSMDYIMKAVTEIEKMIVGPVYAKKGLWYQHDKSFKELIDG